MTEIYMYYLYDKISRPWGGVKIYIGNEGWRAKCLCHRKNPTHCVICVLWKLLWHSRVVVTAQYWTTTCLLEFSYIPAQSPMMCFSSLARSSDHKTSPLMSGPTNWQGEPVQRARSIHWTDQTKNTEESLFLSEGRDWPGRGERHLVNTGGCSPIHSRSTEYSRYKRIRYKNILVTSIPSPVPPSK